MKPYTSKNFPLARDSFYPKCKDCGQTIPNISIYGHRPWCEFYVLPGYLEFVIRVSTESVAKLYRVVAKDYGSASDSVLESFKDDLVQHGFELTNTGNLNPRILEVECIVFIPLD